MKIIIDFENGQSADWFHELLVEISKDLKLINKQNNKIMATIEERFNDVVTKMDTATNRLADQIRDLKGQLTNQGLPAAKEEAILARMEGIANNLDQIGKDPENPIPEPTPAPEGGGGNDNTGSTL